MCVGTSQLESTNKAFVTINKDGLNGHYNVYMYIKGVLYDLKTRLSLSKEGEQI